MGFEQLAALRDQLAAERATREGRDNTTPAKTDKNDDKRPRGPKPAQARQDGRDSRENRDGRPQAGKPQRAPGAARKPQGQSPGRAVHQARPQPETPRDPLLVAIGRLQHAFPKAFPKKPAPRVALKLGIVEDLYAHVAKLRLGEDEIKAAIAAWCSVGRYWAALTKDAVRVDLNGEPSGTVTAAEAGHASFLARQQRKKAQAAAKAAASADTPAASPAATDTPADAPANDAASQAAATPPDDDAAPAPVESPAEVNAPAGDTASA